MAVDDERSRVEYSSTCGGAKIKRKCCTKAPRAVYPVEINQCYPITVELHELKFNCAIIDFRLRIWRIRLGRRDRRDRAANGN